MDTGGAVSNYNYTPRLTNENFVNMSINEKKMLNSNFTSNNAEQINLKNLYQNIGTRVSMLRDLNENYMQKTESQKIQIKNLDEKILEKQRLLQEIRENKKQENKEYFILKYNELLASNNDKKFHLKITNNHVKNDLNLKKIFSEKEKELSALKSTYNLLLKNTEDVKSQIDSLRVENHKNELSLQEIQTKKEEQQKEMDKISLEANKFLKEKGSINRELISINEKIETAKVDYESKISDLNKMIDNTKKIKEFHETLASEKFSKNAFKKTFMNSTDSVGNIINTVGNTKKPVNLIQEEQKKIDDLNIELQKRKKTTIYLNFAKIILGLRQKELQKVILRVQTQTGIENLDKLSEYLELSTKTNKLFESDLKSLNEQKELLIKKIEQTKLEISESKNQLEDVSTKKFEYIEELKQKVVAEEETKLKLNKRILMLNKVLKLTAHSFKDIHDKLNFFESKSISDKDVKY